ncbi:MAG: fructose-1,6-bisphosphatase class 1 2 [Myxococcales bacterium]
MRKIVSVQRHIVENERLHPEATGELTSLLWDLTIAIKMISREVNKAGLVNILGAADDVSNASGDEVKKLDVYAQDVMVSAMSHGGHLGCMASEEEAEVIPIPPGYPRGKYVLIFDPLDGSSNIDANVSIGTIFSIHRMVSNGPDGTLADCLQRGSKQVAAGYVVYGSSTMLVYTTGRGVAGFTLDPSIGEFLLSHPDIRIPQRGKIYSVNEGHSIKWDQGTRNYVEHLKSKEKGPYSGRYIGSMVSDVHRTLLYGGIFMHPRDYSRDPVRGQGKLRLLYEAAPMAMIVEQAGGVATTGTERILDIEPTSLHQRVPVAIGSTDDVNEYLRFLRADL